MKNETKQPTLSQAVKSYRSSTESYIRAASEYMAEMNKLEDINNEMIEYMGKMLVEAITLLKKNGVEVPQTMLNDFEVIKARIGV